MAPPAALTCSTSGAGAAPPSPAGSGQRAQLERAALVLHDPVAKPWGAELGTQKGTIPFHFNPKEVTISKTAQWGRDLNKSETGSAEFKGADPYQLSLEMFFDASGNHDGSVVAAVQSLFDCCKPTAFTTDKKRPLPVLVVFHWGGITSFTAFVTSVSARYTLFASDGTPIRATCTVSLEEMATQQPGTNPTSGALTVRRVHTVVDGDSLASVAHSEYGDPALWRALAAFNEIDDPMVLPRGGNLLIPAIEELLPVRG